MRRSSWLALLMGAVLLSAGSVHAQGRTGTTSPGQQAFDEAMRCLNSDDFGCAEQKFSEAITLDGALIDAYWRLATVHYKNKKYKEAIALLRRAPDQANVDVKEQLGLALYKSAAPPPAEAIKLLDSVVEARPASFAAQLQLGQHFYKSDPKRAATALEACLKNRPASFPPQLEEQVRLLLGTAYLLGRDWDQAVKEFEGLLKSKPNDMNAKLMLGSAQTGKCQNEGKGCSQCITTYEKILGEANKQPSIFYNLGVCYLKNNRPGDALREADLYTKAKGQDGKGWLLKGDAHAAQNQWGPAEQAFNTARNMDKSPSTLCKVGRAHKQLKNYDAAISELEQCTAAEPALFNEFACELVEPYDAKKLKDKLSSIGDKLFPLKQDAKAQQCAARAFSAMGNYEKAGGALANSLALDPNSASTKLDIVKNNNRRAGAFVEKNEPNKALGVLQEAEKLMPDDIMTNRNLGLVYIMVKRWTDGETALRRAAAKVPNDITVNRLIARAQLGQSKTSEAKKSYEKAATEALRKNARGPDLAAVWAEWSTLMIEAKEFEQAVNILEQAVRDAGATPIATAAQRNLSIAYFERGREALRNNKTDQALDDINKAAQSPKGTWSNKEATALACFEWAVALKAGKVQQAEEAIARAKAGGGCALKPPYDKLGTAFIEAYTNYRDTNSAIKRELAGKTFTSLSAKAIGGTKDWLLALSRSAGELAGFDWFSKGDEKRADASLRAAVRVPAKGDRRNIDHNLAVIDMTMGRAGQAEKTFEVMAGRPAESLCNIGIIKDRQGDSKGALQYYKRCWEKGVRRGNLKEWIDTKEKIWGGS
jgi:tetratricopeptide (TPR) repeat protein